MADHEVPAARSAAVSLDSLCANAQQSADTLQRLGENGYATTAIEYLFQAPLEPVHLAVTGSVGSVYDPIALAMAGEAEMVIFQLF
jgi:hypothetical protein